MGMTIEEHITQLKKLKSFHNGSYGASINFALDTMRKYQKIEEIMHKVYTSDSADVCLVQRLAEIRKVIEDGNDV